MGRLEVLQEELNQVEKRISTENKVAVGIRRKLAELCPVVIGEIVEANGYSHKGKKMRVDSVSYKPESWPKETLWKCTGYVIKADGTEGKHRAECRI